MSARMLTPLQPISSRGCNNSGIIKKKVDYNDNLGNSKV